MRCAPPPARRADRRHRIRRPRTSAGAPPRALSGSSPRTSSIRSKLPSMCRCPAASRATRPDENARSSSRRSSSGHASGGQWVTASTPAGTGRSSSARASSDSRPREVSSSRSPSSSTGVRRMSRTLARSTGVRSSALPGVSRNGMPVLSRRRRSRPAARTVPVAVRSPAPTMRSAPSRTAAERAQSSTSSLTVRSESGRCRSASSAIFISLLLSDGPGGPQLK